MGHNLTKTPGHYVPPKNEFKGRSSPPLSRYAIVCSEFNAYITKSLLMGSMAAFSDHGIPDSSITTFWVPGAFEVPLIVNTQFPNFDAIIAIACIIKGDTPHFDYVCNSITQGITAAIHSHKKPGIFCVLTTNTQAEAEKRSQPNDTKNKGYEAALNAIQMTDLMHITQSSNIA